MLVLSRKVGERIVIGPNIIVTVLEVRGGGVKLGCVAPANVPIHREEISRRLDDQRPAEAGRQIESRFFVECA